MKTYRVQVGEKEYIVKLEEVAEGTAPKAPVVEKSEPVVEKSAAPIAGGEEINSPIQGNIWKIIAKNGQSVKAGETVLILEAMKLENEIVAPRDGVVGEILVSEGQNVDAEQPLYTLK